MMKLQFPENNLSLPVMIFLTAFVFYLTSFIHDAMFFLAFLGGCFMIVGTLFAGEILVDTPSNMEAKK